EKVVELTEGTHHVQAMAPRGAPYDPTVLDIDVKPGMETVFIALQHLTELHIEAPLGYRVSVDSQQLAPGRFTRRDHAMTTTVPSTIGEHTVTAVSWHGLTLTQKAAVQPRSRTELVIKPPSLAPGLAIAAVGAGAMIVGGVFLAFNGTCTEEPPP